MVEVADQERAAARADPLAAAEGEDRVAREGAQVLLGPQHRAAERVVAEGGLVDQVLGQHRGLVVRARDLLDHDAALAVELVGVDLRAPDEVGQQVDRLGDHLGAAGDVEGDQVVRGVGVQDRAHRLGGLVDLAVVVVLLAALEHQMLKKMGHPVLFRALRPGAGVEGHEHGRGAGRQLHAVQRQAVRQGGGLDARHRALRLLQGNLRLGRTSPRTVDPQTYGSHRTTSASSPASRRPAPPVLLAPPARHRRGDLASAGWRSATARPTSRSTACPSTSSRASSSSSWATPAPASRPR